jgi:exo-1,4-beta-D-glucosaminidase
MNADGTSIVDNVYWQSTTLDDFGNPAHDDDDFPYEQKSWSTFTALNAMPQVPLEAKGRLLADGSNTSFEITLHNPSAHIAFFERASVITSKDGNEILPIVYSDNYVTVFPGETVRLNGSFESKLADGLHPQLQLEGYNTPKIEVPFE